MADNKYEKIKVSIIVPVYNVPERALRACIESCIKQTLNEIEIILVNDGSTDGSGKICDEYAIKDDRIKVIHKKNEGISAARNVGYRMAKGEWITFLDSDDWLDVSTCKDNYEIGIKEDVDIVIFGTIQEFSHHKNLFKYNYVNGSKFIKEECKKLQCEILNFNGNIATAWAKLIRKCILDKYSIEHNEELRQGSEGIEFNIRLFEYIDSAYFSDRVYYHYIYNPYSVSAKHDEKNHYFVVKCFEEIKRQIEKSKNKEALDRLFYNRFSYVIVAASISGYFSPINKETYRRQKLGFIDYLSLPLVSETISKVDIKKIDKKRAVIFNLIKLHLFFIIKIVAFIRYRQKH